MVLFRLAHFVFAGISWQSKQQQMASGTQSFSKFSQDCLVWQRWLANDMDWPTVNSRSHWWLWALQRTGTIHGAENMKTLQQHRPFLVVVAFDCRMVSMASRLKIFNAMITSVVCFALGYRKIYLYPGSSKTWRTLPEIALTCCGPATWHSLEPAVAYNTSCVAQPDWSTIGIFEQVRAKERTTSWNIIDMVSQTFITVLEICKLRCSSSWRSLGAKHIVYLDVKSHLEKSMSVGYVRWWVQWHVQ